MLRGIMEHLRTCLMLIYKIYNWQETMVWQKMDRSEKKHAQTSTVYHSYPNFNLPYIYMACTVTTSYLISF